MVQHVRAWSLHASLASSGFVLRVSFPGLRFCADSVPHKKSFVSDYKPRSRVYTHAKRSNTHVKVPVVHVRVRWITGTLKTLSMHRSLDSAIRTNWLSLGEATRIFYGRNPSGTMQLFKKEEKKKVPHQNTTFRRMMNQDASACSAITNRV